MCSFRLSYGYKNHLYLAALFWIFLLTFQVAAVLREIRSQTTEIYILNVSTIVNNTNELFLTITGISEKRLLFNNSLAKLKDSSRDGLKRLQVFNYESNAQTININIESSGSVPIQFIFDQILVETASLPPDFHHGILMLQGNINDYMLPFNLISEKYKKIIVEESSFENRPVTYDYEPFLDTFWNQHQKNLLLMSWLPYFSKCQYKTSSRIFLQDVINPWISEDFQLMKAGRICNSSQSWFWSNTLECTDKQIQTKCVLEELNVKKTKKQLWWQNTESPLFYLLNPGIVTGSLLSLDTKSSLESIAQQYYNNLVPLEYETAFNLNQDIPNKFVLHFKILSIDDIGKLQIIQAKMSASKMAQAQTAAAQLNTGETLLILEVQYLSNFQTLIAFGKSPITYLWIYFSLLFVILLICILASKLTKVSLHFSSIARLVLFPISKGFCLAFLLSSCFICFFFLISSKTNYAGISVNFDSNSLDDNWDSYTGRVGLSVLLAGYFLLSTGISQSFKVLTPQETKIVLEDDLLEKRMPIVSMHSGQSAEEGQNSDKHSFIVNNMNSHRKYLVSCMVGYTFLLLLLYYAQVNFLLQQKITFIVIGYPLIHKFTIIVYRHFFIKELLYLTAILATLQSFLDVMVIGEMYLWETILFYILKLVTENLLCFGLEVLSEWMCLHAHTYLNANQTKPEELSKIYHFLSHFKSEVTAVANESRYEKSIFYSNLLSLRFASILTRPFLIMLILLTIKYNFICRDFDESYQELIKTLIIQVCFAPLDVLVMGMGIKFFQTKFSLQILKCLEFNKFKFNRRKVRWVSDSFAQNKSIQYFYRQFQKFCFSSQMYLLIFIISFSLLTLMIGFKIILEVSYVAFVDPAMLVILGTVWLTGNSSSIVASFLAIKLRIYQRKQDGKMRAKLQNVEKILKKTDFSQYFHTESVKNYFLFFCKDWIIQNITKIFDKEDFTDNNYEFLLKYKHYKSLLKKKKIQERKMQERKNEQENSKNIQKEQKDRKIVIKLPEKQFNELAKPIVSSWLYIAKQFVFLKGLVRNLRQVYKKQSCQICSMNIELQVIEKIQFSTLVNEYRLMNIGRIFKEEHFIQFYRHKQEHITLCIQCKDKKLYLEKTNLDVNGAPRKLLSKWLIIARSSLLHRQNQEKNTSF